MYQDAAFLSGAYIDWIRDHDRSQEGFNVRGMRRGWLHMARLALFMAGAEGLVLDLCLCTLVLYFVPCVDAESYGTSLACLRQIWRSTRNAFQRG